MPPRVASVIPMFVPAGKTGDVGFDRCGQIGFRSITGRLDGSLQCHEGAHGRAPAIQAARDAWRPVTILSPFHAWLGGRVAYMMRTLSARGVKGTPRSMRGANDIGRRW